MVRKSLLVVSAIMALSIAVLWPVSYWWHSTWYDTIQNGTLRGYWCGYALVNGDFVIQWDSQRPPNLALPAFSMATPRGPVTYFDGLGEEPSSRYVGVRIPPSSGTRNPPSPSVIYRPDNLVAFAFLGFKLDYDPNMRVAYIDTPLPMLAFPFALLALILWIQGPLRRRRRRKRRLCLKCGYNLKGSESGVCPECGTASGMRPEEYAVT